MLERSGYELSDLEDIEFFWENPQVDLNAVSKPGIDTPISPTVCKNLELGEEGSSGSPMVWNEHKVEENSPPTFPLSERPTEPTGLLKCRPFARRIENVPEYVSRFLFE